MFVLGLVIFLAALLAPSLVQKNSDQSNLGSSLNLLLKNKIETLGEGVLGTAAKHLPAAPGTEEIEINVQEQKGSEDGQSVEPIREPSEKIKGQTEDLVEMIKNLPQDQVEAIKKQIYQDFCQSLLGGENE